MNRSGSAGLFDFGGTLGCCKGIDNPLVQQTIPAVRNPFQGKRAEADALHFFYRMVFLKERALQ